MNSGILYKMILHVNCILTIVIDIKQDKFLEKRDFYEVLNETMGGGFGIHWLLPIKEGGYKPFFNNLKQRKEFS
jgi:hypothetical protein